MVNEKTKKKARTLDERIAELQARKDAAEKRARAVDALEAALRAVRDERFGDGLGHALKAVDVLTPADATQPLKPVERAAE
jgi:hypothetical protein